MTCQWCKRTYTESILNHVCFDGSTFDDRVNHYLKGDKAPSSPEPKQIVRYRGSNSTSKYDMLDLTADDYDMLKGMKIKPELT